MSWQMFCRPRSPRAGLLFFLPLIFSACTWGTQRVSSQVVVRVQDHSLTVREFSNQLANKLKGFDALSAKDSNNILRAKNEIIQAFILKSLIQDYAKENKIEISDKELENEINSIRSNYPDDISFRKSLAEENLSLSEWKESFQQSLLSQKVYQLITNKVPQPTEDEIKARYSEEKDHFRRPERILLRQIVVDDLTKAKMISEEAKKRDFADLAKKYSVAPEAKAGGLVGWIDRGSVDIFDKAFSMSAGGISQVLESSYGFHLFKVEKKQPPGLLPLADVAEQIRRELLSLKKQGEYLSWLDRQIRSTKVLQDNILIGSITVETVGEK